MNKQQLRFALVGVFNTFVDVFIYTVLTLLSVNVLLANFVSTSAGLLVSYSLNRSFTFRSTSANKRREFALFLTVTLVGLWIIHPLVIMTVNNVAYSFVELLPEVLRPVAPKMVAVCIGLVWNYVWYSKVVFKKQDE